MSNKKHSEAEKIVLMEVEITNWAHNYGLEDDDCLSAGEAHEMLEAGIEHFLALKDHQTAEAVKAERERVVAKVVKWMRIENDISIVQKDQWEAFISSLLGETHNE